MLAITIIPFVAFVAAVALLWNTAVGWTDLGLLVVLYVFCGFGITIGFHRMLTHSAFEAVKPLKAGLLIFGSMAVQGSAITWAVDHRTHHAHSDKEGDPHSPHHGFGGGVGGQLRGLLHAHMGWMFSHPAGQERERMARDLSQDRLVRFIDRTFLLWAVLGFVLPFALGFALTGTWRGALTGLLWGGLVRLFLNHHVTWSVNSICHYFGRRPFPAYDLSTNNWLLALPVAGRVVAPQPPRVPDLGLPRPGQGAVRRLRPHDPRLGEDGLGDAGSSPHRRPDPAQARPRGLRATRRRS